LQLSHGERAAYIEKAVRAALSPDEGHRPSSELLADKVAQARQLIAGVRAQWRQWHETLTTPATAGSPDGAARATAGNGRRELRPGVKHCRPTSRWRSL
jgi:hypothetical protein